MRQPQSNGLFDVVTAKPAKEEGFGCMKLIIFLTNDGVTDWDEWHQAHQLAASGKCTYSDRCPIYKKTVEKMMLNK